MSTAYALLLGLVIFLGLFIYLPLTSCSQKNNTTSPIAENNKHAIPQEKLISNPALNCPYGWSNK